MSKFKTPGASIELDPEWITRMTTLLNGQPVGLYARVSGNASADGSSLDSQIEVNRRFALACGATIVAEYSEVITGVFITARSKFNALLELAEKAKIKFIIVDVRDRLGRGEAISVLEFLSRQQGAQIIYATQPADLDTYEGVALDATETLVSRIERLNIQRRTNRGRREWASEGRVFTGRFYPYGYRNSIIRDEKGRLVERTLVVFEPEAGIVRKIFHWFVYDDMSTYAIAVRLEREGVPVPEGHRNDRTRTSTQWYHSTIDRILQNEAYAGTWHYAKREMKRFEAGNKIRYKSQEHPPEHRIAIQVPDIIPRDLWQAAQAVLQKHASGRRTPKNEYLLSGMLRCIKSNANMHGQTAVYRENAYGYYVCPHRSPRLRLDPSTRCDAHRLQKTRLENWVWNTIMRLAEDPQQIQAELVRRRREAESEQHLTRQAMAGLQKGIARFQRQKGELLDLYLNRDRSGVNLTREEYESKARQIGEETKRLETQLTEMQEQTKSAIITPEQSDQAMLLLNDVRIAAKHATFQEKRTLLRLLDIRILYDGVRIELTGGIPTQQIALEELLDRKPIGGNSSLPPQSARSEGSQLGAEGNSTFEDHKRSTDCTRN